MRGRLYRTGHPAISAWHGVLRAKAQTQGREGRIRVQETEVFFAPLRWSFLSTIPLDMGSIARF